MAMETLHEDAVPLVPQTEGLLVTVRHEGQQAALRGPTLVRVVDTPLSNVSPHVTLRPPYLRAVRVAKRAVPPPISTIVILICASYIGDCEGILGF